MKVARFLPLLLLTACIPGVVLAPGSPFDAQALTRYSGDAFITVLGDQARLSIQGAGEASTRIAWWPAGAPLELNEESCVTWESSTHEFWQPGVALRVTSSSAITVTRNVWANQFDKLNVHVWDLTAPADESATQVAEFPTAVAGEPLPLRLCAQVVYNSIRVKIWHPFNPEPDWGLGDGTSAQANDVFPPRFVAPGFAGWYAGHIQPDQSAVYMDLTTRPI